MVFDCFEMVIPRVEAFTPALIAPELFGLLAFEHTGIFGRPPAKPAIGFV